MTADTTDLLVASARLAGRFAEALAAKGIDVSLPEWMALAAIAEAGTIRPVPLGRQLGLARAQVQAATRRLVRSGLVLPVAPPAGGTVVGLSIAEPGRRTLAAVDALLAALDAPGAADTSGAIAAITAASQRLAATFPAPDPAP